MDVWSTSNKMICDVCKGALTSGKAWGFHHRCAAAFQEAKDQLCVFCTRLEFPSPGFPLGQNAPDGSDGAVYRWTLREAAKVAEQQDCLVITFRSVLADDALPDAVFYLLQEEGE